VSAANWIPAHASDEVINLFYIGDYDALTNDFLLQHGGFFGAFEVQTKGNRMSWPRGWRRRTSGSARGW